MRKENSGIRYFSFRELSNTKKTKKKKVNKEKQEKFLGTCKVCNQLMTYVKGTNVITCDNPDCKGIKRKRKNGEVYYTPVFRILNEKNMSYAEFLFGE